MEKRDSDETKESIDWKTKQAVTEALYNVQTVFFFYNILFYYKFPAYQILVQYSLDRHLESV